LRPVRSWVARPKDAMLAMDEPLLRRANLRVHEFSRSDEVTRYFCECSGVSCGLTVIDLTTAEFADVLAMQDVWLVARGHEEPADEVVRERPAYLIVRQSALDE